MKQKTHLLGFLFFVLFSNSFSVAAQAEHSLYLYSSLDGTSFINPIYLIDSADVPSITQDSSGQLICVYQLFKGGMSSANWDKIGVMFSTDNGLTWSANSYLNITGFTGTNQRAFDPTITVTTDNKYRLYFSYCPNTTILDSTCDTYSAISTDAINFTFESGARFDILNEKVIDPTVVYFNSTWHYSAPIAPNPPTPVYGGARHATSSDGVSFSFIDSIGVGNPNIKWTGNLLNDGTLMRFYGYTDNTLGDTIWWSESTDGSTWGAYMYTNVTGKDPGIVKTTGGEYLMVVPKTTSPLSTQEQHNSIIEVITTPNPFKHTTTIAVKNLHQTWNWILYNSTGQLVQRIENIDQQRLEVNRANLASGVYYYQIQTMDKFVSSGKLMIH